MAANQTQIPVIQTPDGNITQIQQNSNKVLRNIYNQVSTLQNSNSSLSIDSASANKTLSSVNSLVLCDASLGAFNLTLPDAKGLSSVPIYLKKVDSSFNQVNILTQNNQTIDLLSSKTLATQNEVWTVVSDGSNWQALDHQATTPAQSSLAWTPHSLGTIASSSIWWTRDGDKILTHGTFAVGTTIASVADIAFQSGIAIDPNKYSTSTHGQKLGNVVNTNGNPQTPNILWYDGSTTSKLFFARQSSSGAFVKQNGNDMSYVSGDFLTFDFSFHVLGWSA